MTAAEPGAAALLDRLRPGATLYLPGATGESAFVQRALAADPDRLEGVRIVGCFLPGMNMFDYAALHAGCRVQTFLFPPSMRPSFEAGRVEVLPISYTAVARHLAAMPIDVAVLHLTPASGGMCSFGIAADFGPIVAKHAKCRIGLLNRAMPRPVDGPTIALSELDATIEIDEPPIGTDGGDLSAELQAIAANVAALVPNGATVQTGIGQAPNAIWRALGSHRDLRLWSGVVGDGFLQAVDGGATAGSGHVAGIAYGSESLYARLDGSSLVRFADTRTTHGVPARQIDRFTAINSALEVDLFGQANLEWQGTRLLSGVVGAPDFTIAARGSQGGRAIIALPATARRGTLSRITTRLNAPAVSLGRADLDTVVTEHGSARLIGLSIDARAEALIAIAAPEHRDRLSTEWAELRPTL